MAKKSCKKLYQQKNIQLAIGAKNELYLRVYGNGAKGPCWGSWQPVDLNPASWDKLDESRVRPDYYRPGIKTLDQDFVESLDTYIELYKKN